VNTHGSSHVGAIAHVAAMADGRDWLARLLAELDANRALLGRLLAEHLPGVRWQAPEATYLAWLDCRDLGLGDDPAAAFRDRGRVALSSGPNYGREVGRGFARLNFATSPEVLEEAVRRMASTLS
jgi:cystathionine beta-lyase